jgi:hypothetical protein
MTVHPGFATLPTPDALKELCCAVCKQVPLKPCMPSCGHLHCLVCWKSNRKIDCIICNSIYVGKRPADLSEPQHQALRNVIANILVECKACKQHVPRGLNGELFESHKPVCVVQCEYCNASMLFANLEAHQLVCDAAQKYCVGCEFKGLQGAVDEHERTCIAAHLEPLQASLSRLQDQQVDLEAINRLTARVAALEADRLDVVLWKSHLPLKGSYNQDNLHFKFQVACKQPEHIMFYLLFEGHLFTGSCAMEFRAVGYLDGMNGCRMESFHTQRGSACVVRAYQSSDHHLALEVSSGGLDWHASTMTLRLIKGHNAYHQRAQGGPMTVIAVEHRVNDF